MRRALVRALRIDVVCCISHHVILCSTCPPPPPPPPFSPPAPLPIQFDGEGVEAEADSVVNQVLAEIGLDVDGQMLEAPTHAPAVAKPASAEDTKLDAKTEEMLRQLDAL